MAYSLKTLGLSAVTLSASLLLMQSAAAIPYLPLGDLDADFNASDTPGYVITTGSGMVANAVAIQPDGKIVTAGYVSGSISDDMAVVRYNADGSLDTSFDSDGIATLHFTAGSSYVNSVVVQPDGKIVVCGTVDVISPTAAYDFILIRFNSDGSLDSSFGAGGKVTTDLDGTFDQSDSIALQADGKLVVAGVRGNGSGGSDYVLARYNSDGSLDSDFGTNGWVSTALGNKTSNVNASLALQADGKIVYASTYQSAPPDTDFFAARYTANGVLDTTFNSGGSAPGTATTDLGSNLKDQALSVIAQPDGKIVVGGYAANSGKPNDMALVRYNADGSLDTGFATGGKLKFNFGIDGNASVQALAQQPNGKLIAAGYAGNPRDLALIRVDANGVMEAGRLKAFSTEDTAYAVAVQPDGKLVAAGYASDGTTTGVLVARYASDGPWDTTPDAFSFTDVSDVAKDSVQTSNMITVAGLDSDVMVPVSVSGGEYAKNGSTTYTKITGWAQNGDTFNVRHTAASSGSQTTDTVLTVGGIAPANNLAQALGTTASDTFTSTTSADNSNNSANSNGSTSSGGGGSGSFGFWSLALLIARGWRRRARP